MITQEYWVNVEKYKKPLLFYSGLLAVICITIIYTHQILIASNNLFSTDFYKFYQSTRFYFAGQDIYAKIIRPLNPTEALALHSTSFILPSDLNSPFFILLLLPMAWLSYSKALLFWSAISFIATCWGILLVIKSYPDVWNNKHIRIWSFAGFLLYFPTYANFCLGQVSSILLLITAGAWLACRKGQDSKAGILLGFALSLKLFYGLFLIYFIARKQWRALISLIATFLSCSIIALLFYSNSVYKNYFNTLQHVRWYASSWNASIFGFLIRIFGTGHEGNHALIKLPSLAYPVYVIIASCLLIYLLWVIWQSSHKKMQVSAQEKQDVLDWQFSLTITLMLLLSPLAWLYYFTLLIIPFITIIRLSDKLANFNINFFLLILILLLSGLPNNYRLPIEMVKISMVITWASYYFYALILLFILLVMLRIQIDRKSLYVVNKNKLTQNVQLLLYLLAAYPSFITLVFATLNIVG
jgi:hypothetical protein